MSDFRVFTCKRTIKTFLKLDTYSLMMSVLNNLTCQVRLPLFTDISLVVSEVRLFTNLLINCLFVCFDNLTDDGEIRRRPV